MTPGQSRAKLVLVAAIAAAAGLAAALFFTDPKRPAPASGHLARAEAPANTASVIGQIPPPIPVQTLQGETLPLPLPTGQPLLINVWATWCAPCVKEMPILAEFAQSQGKDGIQVLGLALDEAAAVKSWLEQRPSPYPHFLDTPGPRDGSVVLGNRAGLLPYTVLIAADGRIAAQHLGPFHSLREISDWAKDRL